MTTSMLIRDAVARNAIACAIWKNKHNEYGFVIRDGIKPICINHGFATFGDALRAVDALTAASLDADETPR